VIRKPLAHRARCTLGAGWKWSEHVKPIAKTDSCQAAHTGYFVSGRMKVVMDDGEQMEYGPGDFAIMAPGYDGWIVGNEPCVVIDWQGTPTTPSDDLNPPYSGRVRHAPGVRGQFYLPTLMDQEVLFESR
jgi:hypothetical protein